MRSCVTPGGYLLLATFSEQGADGCSGITTRKYSEQTMTNLLILNLKKSTALLLIIKLLPEVFRISYSAV